MKPRSRACADPFTLKKGAGFTNLTTRLPLTNLEVASHCVSRSSHMLYSCVTVPVYGFWQVEQHRLRANESGTAVQASNARADAAEQALRQEQARVSPLYGLHLEALSSMELAGLASVHEDGLRRIRALQVGQARTQTHMPTPMHRHTHTYTQAHR